MAKERVNNGRLVYALRHCNGKLVLISGTEHLFFVFHALEHGLMFYCEQKPIVLGRLEPPIGARLFAKHKHWTSDTALDSIQELVRQLDMYSPSGWHFHTPVFGIVCEYGWFPDTMKILDKHSNFLE